jgi:drug/metabolite transporter (DMT)-like permease
MKTKAQIYGIIAAALFGASAPFSKLMLSNISPLQLAGVLYLGSGFSLLVIKLIKNASYTTDNSAKLEKKDFPWLAGAVVSGGILAPICLLFGLSITPAATASILLNFEAVATALIATLFFHEHLGKKVIYALILLTLASLILTFEPSGKIGISWGAILIIAACAFWGIDNNLTRNISSKDPLTIVIVKGTVAGIFSILLSVLMKNPVPSVTTVTGGLILGGLSYGISLILFILTLKEIGASRASALFASAPFIGAIISFMLFWNFPSLNFIIAVPIMLFGTFLLFSETHLHSHTHEAIEHEHSHNHVDEHHMHQHGNLSKDIVHSHKHFHELIVHTHNHMPDIHHRHIHGAKS